MKSKKIIIASLVGSIGVAVLSLSLSLAWYNTSENLYLDTLNISVTGEKSILISTSGEEGTFVESVQFKKNEEKNDLKDAGLFSPVSSMFKSRWIEDDSKNEPELYVYSNSAVNLKYEPVPDPAPWGYYSQHLYLYSTSSVLVTIDSEDFNLSEIEASNKEYANYLLTQVHVRDKYAAEHPDWTNEQIFNDIVSKLSEVKKCMRTAIYDISMKKFYIIDPYKESETLLGGRADLFGNRYYDSHQESDGDRYETIFGEVSNREKAVYLPVNEKDTPAPETYTSFDSRTQAGVHALNLNASLENGLEIAKEDSMTVTEAEAKIFLRLKSMEPKEIVLLTYLEGWDTDCTNQHMGSTFNLDMKFKISEERQ